MKAERTTTQLNAQTVILLHEIFAARLFRDFQVLFSHLPKKKNSQLTLFSRFTAFNRDGSFAFNDWFLPDDDRIISHDAFFQKRHAISQSWQIS